MKALGTFIVWLWSLLVLGFEKLFGLVSQKAAAFTYEVVDDVPEELKPRRVYLVGEGKNLWAAAMVCPCGCNEKIELNLLKGTRPCWHAEPHGDGLVTLSPSVWRKKGCKSHFILQRGQIIWC
jgi:Family of unknown function (DUF6527)